MKVIANDYSHIVKGTEKPLNVVKEYDKNGVHYIEYDDGTVVSSTSTANNGGGANWKTKKDYVRQMNLFNKILYYLWVIVLYKYLPIQQTGHLVDEKPFLQTLQASTYSTYWHWNWWNPLTYVVVILFIAFMFVMNVVISIIQTIKMTSIIRVEINDE